MKTANIENLVVFRDRGIYGYSVRYKSGITKTKATGSALVLPDTLHKFMKTSPYSVAHDDSSVLYHEVVYYCRDIRRN